MPPPPACAYSQWYPSFFLILLFVLFFRLSRIFPFASLSHIIEFLTAWYLFLFQQKISATALIHFTFLNSEVIFYPFLSIFPPYSSFFVLFFAFLILDSEPVTVETSDMTISFPVNFIDQILQVSSIVTSPFLLEFFFH
jgi:hypothetical protein